MLIALPVFAFLATAPVQAAPASVPSAVFAKKCASCHGQDGRGNGKMETMLKLAAGTLDLSRESSLKLSADEVEATVRKGKGKMPAFEKKLTAEDLADALKFVAGIREMHKPAAK